MTPVSADKMSESSPERHTSSLPFSMISELLETVLTDQNEILLFQARSQGFLYDTTIGMKTNEMLTVRVENENIIEQKSEIEITLSGTVITQNDLKETYTLYFYMWWDQMGSSPIKNSCGKTTSGKSLVVNTGLSSLHLSDSIFELDLYRKSLSREQEFLGQGRGYLVFGRER